MALATSRRGRVDISSVHAAEPTDRIEQVEGHRQLRKDSYDVCGVCQAYEYRRELAVRGASKLESAELRIAVPCMVDVVDVWMCGRQPSQLISQILGMEVEGHR